MKRFFIIILSLIFLFFPHLSFAAEIFTTDKLISVDVSKQKLYAWEGGKVQKEITVSTGLWQSPTVKGTFRIYKKYPAHDMRGISPVKGKYFLPNVPNVMYFYQGYAIHGTYWHSNFGTPMSNGCVNASPADSKWLYDWAKEGTQVVVF